MYPELTQTIKKVLNQARASHKAVVQERIDHIAKMSDVVQVTNGMYEVSKVLRHNTGNCKA
jgi:F-type H+-transporting ATPase subunit b